MESKQEYKQELIKFCQLSDNGSDDISVEKQESGLNIQVKGRGNKKDKILQILTKIKNKLPPQCHTSVTSKGENILIRGDAWRQLKIILDTGDNLEKSVSNDNVAPKDTKEIIAVLQKETFAEADKSKIVEQEDRVSSQSKSSFQEKDNLLKLRVDYIGPDEVIKEVCRKYNAATFRAADEVSNGAPCGYYIVRLRDSFIGVVGKISQNDKPWLFSNIYMLLQVFEKMKQLLKANHVDPSSNFDNHYYTFLAYAAEVEVEKKKISSNSSSISTGMTYNYLSYLLSEIENVCLDGMNVLFHPSIIWETIIDSLKSPLKASKMICSLAYQRPWYLFFSTVAIAGAGYSATLGIQKVKHFLTQNWNAQSNLVNQLQAEVVALKESIEYLRQDKSTLALIKEIEEKIKVISDGRAIANESISELSKGNRAIKGSKATLFFGTQQDEEMMKNMGEIISDKIPIKESLNFNN